MDLHHYGVIAVLVGFLISLVWIVLDNKNFMKNLTNSAMGGIIKRKKSKEGKTMKIIHEFPRLVSKPKYGLYMVTAIHSDGTTHSKGYTAMSSTEAKYRYLVEFGKVRGEIQTKFLPTP